ncbi:MAG: acyl-CoA dehydrogenase [Pseudonocardiales bacterium]|nr:MAG: acyl-CoA dehydrogenase [Pseudonocardiales bacterium]
MTDLLYSEVEEQLRSSVRDLLTDRAPAAAVLARTETEELYDPALWHALAVDFGTAGLAVPESAGGQGASWRETAIVAEELGRSVAATPFLGSTVLATALVIAAGEKDLVRRLATGEVTATVAVPLSTAPGSAMPATVRHSDGTLSGTVRNVIDARMADLLIVPALSGDEPALFAVDADEVGRAAVVSLDPTRPLTDVTFDYAHGELIASGADAVAAFDTALVTGAAMLAAEQLGLAQRCLELTVEHLLTRYQFGRQIGSYQALKHRMADLWAGITQARAVARYAVTCVADDDPDVAVAASLAQAYCSLVAVKAAEECVQLHGGTGFTWEHPAHLYLKRAKADAITLGTAGQHRAHLGDLVNLPAA